MSSGVAAQPESAAPNERKRKRPRAARACESCRAKKLRCDEMYPCAQCKRQKADCVYDGVDHIHQRILESSYINSANQGRSRAADLERPGPGSDLSREATTDSRGLPVSPAIVVDTGNIQHSSVTVRPDAPVSTSVVAQASVPSDSYDITETEVEVSDINPHTQNIEFHGKTSTIAFLAALKSGRSSRAPNTELQASGPPQVHDETSLVSTFHNDAFSPESPDVNKSAHAALDAERYYFRQSQLFLEGHFQNIHFIHPILHKASFMSRCEDLWFGNAARQSKSFVALYYSVMSLGALVRTWDDGEKIDGLGRLGWSRKLYGLADIALGNSRSNSDLDTVQAQFFMAKVSQNELNMSLAYMFLGLATRTAFSAGYNRAPTQKVMTEAATAHSAAISRTWWGLYSLEIEISFALGRPDSCGPDEYHNRPPPPSDDSEFAIIPAMIKFAQIIRKVCTSLHLSHDNVDDKIRKALEIEREMDVWLSELPENIRPTLIGQTRMARITKEPLWAKRQKVVLELRYYNVKMVLFRPILIQAAEAGRDPSHLSSLVANKCLEAARNTVSQMHDNFVNQPFFRTWWYNTTYILYAASIVLGYASKTSHRHESTDLLDLGDKAVDILESMNESVVARNGAHMLKRVIAQLRGASKLHNDRIRAQENVPQLSNDLEHTAIQSDDAEGLFPDLGFNLDFFDLTFPLDNSQLPFWADPENINGMF